MTNSTTKTNFLVLSLALSTFAVASIHNGAYAEAPKYDSDALDKLIESEVKIEEKPAPAPANKQAAAPDSAPQLDPMTTSYAPKGSPQGLVIYSEGTTTKRLIITFNQMPKFSSEKGLEGQMSLTFAAPVSISMPKIPAAYKSSYSDVQIVQVGGATKVVIRYNPKRQIMVTQKPNMAIIDVVTPEGEEKKEEQQQKLEQKTPEKKIKADYWKENDIEKIKFSFSAPTPAAAFFRYGYAWIVFDTQEKTSLKVDLQNSDIIQNVTKPNEKFQAYQIMLKKETGLKVKKDGNAWVFEFDPQYKDTLFKSLSVMDTPTAWQIKARHNKNKIEIRDTEVGGEFVIIPLNDLGFGFDKEYKNESFIVNPTLQGVLIEKIDPVVMDLTDDSTISLIKPKKEIKPQEQVVEIPKQPVANDKIAPLFKFENWEQLTGGKFSEVAATKKKSGDLFEYGKFLFTQGLYSEAAENLKDLKTHEANWMFGVSSFMVGRYQDALFAFDRVIVKEGADPNELLIWRNAANNKLSQISPSESVLISLAEFSLPKNFYNYPKDIQCKLLFGIVEKYLSVNKLLDAQAFLNLLPKDITDQVTINYKLYLQAKIFDANSKKSRAAEIWKQVVNSNSDRETRAKSQYEIIMQQLKSKKIDAKAATKALEDLRIVWRGDLFEYELLYSLGELYERQLASLDALRVYKEMLTNFPNFPKNKEISERMRQLFLALTDISFANKDDTFKAVSIYYEFEELTPAGEDGGKLLLKLAEALIRVDLLSDAAKVLEKYQFGITDDLEKAEVGTRIAILHYLQNKFDQSISDLDNSRTATEIPDYIKLERKVLLARNLIDLRRFEDANKVIATLPSEMFFRFKADILWKQKKYDEIVEAYRYVQDKSPDDIMRLAIANVMIADDAALEQLKLEYDDMMKFSKYYDKFSYITDTSNVDFRDLATTLKIEDTQKIINEYKAKVKNKKLKSEEEKKPLNQVKFEKLKPPEDEKAKEGEAKKPEEAAKKESESIKENKE